MESCLNFKDAKWVANEVRKERLRRKLLGDLVEFCKYFYESRGDKFLVNRHHEKIRDSLNDVKSGKIKNLLINMPPRYGKTAVAVICFIAQSIAANPKAKFIHLSYSDDLALENSSSTRELIMSEAFQELWPIQLKEDANSKKKWYTLEGGGLYATSTGGPVTGFGAGATVEDKDALELFYGAIIIDDPIKIDDAFSKEKRDFINARLNNTFKSRRNNRWTPIIIIMQRVNEDDMSGYVLNGGMGEEFHHLKLAAINDDGTPLWSVKHTIEELERERRADAFTFSGQMMQEPSPEDGIFFKKEWFKRYRLGEEPKNLIKYGAGDYAVSDGKGDFTEQAIAGFDNNQALWILDWWSGKTTSDVWIEEQIKLARRYEPMIWAAEGGIIRRAVEPYLLAAQRKSGCFYRLEWLTSNQNKAANARSFQAMASQGNVWIPQTVWGDELIIQLLQFPSGKHDDKVDVCGLFGRILDKMFVPNIQVEKQEEFMDIYGLENSSNALGWKVN